ncbi:Melanopsin [Strongyloides ratti]|uniref:Melanopsin n=1 Tax=Strongyloides ratti TaxID=34506 RepID=A0A090LNL0_STRRB|nr:Melanopsin [Strongyloides ratti]CEF69115.1 Melanopsin [Strongyloides ratti]
MYNNTFDEEFFGTSLTSTIKSLEFKDTANGTIFLSFCMIIIVFFGFFGNGLIVYAFIRDGHLRKKNFLLIVISTLYAFGSLFFTLDIYHLYNNKVMEDPICTIHAFAISTLSVGGIHQLSVMSLERYVGVNHPFILMKLPLRTKVLFATGAFVWTLLTTTPPLFGWSRYKVLDDSLHYCVFDYLSKEKSTQKYIMYLFFNGYILPLSIIGFSNYKIFLAAKGLVTSRKTDVYHKRLRSIPSSSTFLSDSETDSNLQKLAKICESTGLYDSETQQSLSVYDKQQRKCATVIFFCVGSFIISWTPYAFTSIVWNIIFNYKLNPTFVLLTAIAAKMFVIWNPIIYGFMDKSFQRECEKILFKKFNYWLE